MPKKNRQQLSEAEARLLSRKLYPLGEQCPELWEELERAGYWEPIRIWRQRFRELAGSAEKYAQLERYWVEYGKEMLAALAASGTMNILSGPWDNLKGQLPEFSAYRSAFLEKLREDARAGLLKSEGKIASPQIEPTLKRFFDMLLNNPALLNDPVYGAAKLHNEIKEARKQAVLALGLQEETGFSSWDGNRKYDALLARYRAHLEPVGFSVGPLRKHGVIFRKPSSDGRWSLIFSEESREEILAGYIGKLDSTIAISTPGVDVVPRVVGLRAVVDFQPDVLVDGFRVASEFDMNSYAQLCLACDANALFAKSVCARIDKLISQSP